MKKNHFSAFLLLAQLISCVFCTPIANSMAFGGEEDGPVFPVEQPLEENNLDEDLLETSEEEGSLLVVFLEPSTFSLSAHPFWQLRDIPCSPEPLTHSHSVTRGPPALVS